VGDLSDWEEKGWEVIRVLAPRYTADAIRRWRIAFVDETRRRLFVCPDPRDLVVTPQWEGWDEPSGSRR
jgi:hypothetical protein